MKKYLLFLTVTAIAVNTLAQNKLYGYLSELKTQNENLSEAVNNLPGKAIELNKIILELPGYLKMTPFGLKNALIEKQKLDSTHTKGYKTETESWELSGIDRFTYDAAGNNTLYITLDYDVDLQKMEYSDRAELEYNSSGMITVETDYSWSGSEWVGSFRSEYTYYQDFQIESIIRWQMNTTSGEWEPYNKTIYSYGQQNILMYISYNWDQATSDWVPAMKVEFTYEDGNNTLSVISNYDDATQDWVDYWKTEYFYDSNDLLTGDIGYMWMEPLSLWMESNKADYTYDNNGNNIEALYSNWDYLTSGWKENGKDVMTYNSNNQLLIRSEFRINVLTSQWEEHEREENQYDSHGNLVLKVYLNDNGTGILVNESKREYTYNTSYTYDDLILPSIVGSYGLGFMFNNMLTESKEYYGDNDQWIPSEWFILYYSTANISGTSIQKEATVSIMPNPASDYLIIDIGEEAACTAMLYNLVGQLVNECQFTGTTELPVNHLNDGIYFIKLKFNGKSDYTKKIIVK